MGVSITPIVSPVVTRAEIVQELIDETIWAIFTEGNIANGANKVLSIVTPAAPAIIAFEEITFNVGNSANFDFLEGPTVDVTGSVITAYNPQRNAAGSTTVVARENDQVSGGTLLVGNPLGAGSKNQPTGGAFTGDRGWILLPSTVYSFVLNNNSGSAQDMGIVIRFLQV